MSLKKIIGHEKTISLLLGVMGRRRVASSYLFCGEPGIGKKTVAINFAKALNCQEQEGFNLQPSTFLSQPSSLNFAADACDECSSCLKIVAGTHPDFLLISPQERQIRIEEIRMIDDALSFKPFEGRKKTIIVDDAEAMNISAVNAFLKTLEEPPPDSMIILVTAKPDLLPATIRSRCSRINFSPLSSEACRQVLRGKISDNDLELAVRLSMGRPGIALATDFKEERVWFLDLFRSMLNAGKDGWTSREDMERWFEYALVLFRDMAVFSLTGNASILINTDLREYIAGLSKSGDLKVIIYIYQEVARLKGLLMFNLNKSITWNYTASLLRKEL
jgi:DNA polymerase-3 subunit delta'